MKIWAKPLSFVYKAATDLRNDLYAKNYLHSVRLNIPVISVGNLTMGGTGKTPVVDYLIKYFVDNKKKVAVVSRAYKAEAQEPCLVDASLPRASQIFGDEPLWLAQQNPLAAIFVGQNKAQIAQWAVQQQKFDVLIVDDGFQHRALERDLNIVLLDATEKLANYQVVPAGRAREDWRGIHRADLVIVTKSNWAQAGQLEELVQKIPDNKIVLKSHFAVSALKNFMTGEVKDLQEFKNKSALLFCSVAQPQVFKQNLQSSFSHVEILAFSDHHVFHQDDIESLLAKKKAAQADLFVCSQKDAVKLKELWPHDQDLWVTDLKINFNEQRKDLHAILDRHSS